MANPQPDNYFKFSIELFEALCKTRINGEARQILDVIIRHTYGFHRKSAEIPTLKFMKITGLHRQAVYKARKKLIDMNIIGVTQKGDTLSPKKVTPQLTYCIQKDYEKWKVSPKKVISPKKVTPCHPKRLHPVTQKGDTIARNEKPVKGCQVAKDNIKDNIKDNNTMSEKNPDIKIFIDYAYQTFKNKYDAPMMINGKKDGSLVKKLLQQFDIEKIKALWNKFLLSEDDFILNAGKSIGVFYSQINKLISGCKARKQGLTEEEFLIDPRTK